MRFTSKLLCGKLILPYQSIRGCPYRCSFCSYRIEESFSFKTPEKAVSEIQMISDKYTTKFFFFLNNMLSINKKYLQGFCKEIRKLDLLWSDSFKYIKIPAKEFSKIRNSGCIILTHGLESSSHKILTYVNKNLDPANFAFNLKNADKAGIWNLVNLIIGFPYETETDINENLKFIEKYKGFINSVRIHEFGLAIKSEMFDEHGKFRIKFDNYEIQNNISACPYDEMDGLKWKDKIAQNKVFINKVSKFLINNNMDTASAYSNRFQHRLDLIYNLYDKYHDKKEVVRNLKNLQ